MTKPSTRRRTKPKGPGFFTKLIVGLIQLVGAASRQVRKEAQAMRGKGGSGSSSGGSRQGQQPRARSGQRSAGGGGATPGREHPRAAADRRSRDVWGDREKDRDPWEDDDRKPARSGGRGSEDGEEEPAWKRHGFPNPDKWDPEQGEDPDAWKTPEGEQPDPDDPFPERTAEQDAFGGHGRDDGGEAA